jgi:hypothetical protein
MKFPKQFAVLTLILVLPYFVASVAYAEAGPSTGSPETLVQLADTPKQLWIRDGLGYWFNDFKWVGFDDWSFELKVEDPSRTFTYEYVPVVFLMRVPSGRLQPYMGILPYVTMSSGTFDLHLNDPGVMFGLWWRF